MRYAPKGFRAETVTGAIVLAALAFVVGSCSADRVTAPPTSEAIGDPELAKLKKSPPGLCQTDRSRPEAAQGGIANARAHACVVAAIEIVTGNAQEIIVARTASAQLVARLVDGVGNGVVGIPVAWSITAGGGRVTNVSIESAADGMVRATYAADTVAGTAQITVSLIDGSLGAVFDAAIMPDAPFGLEKVSDDDLIFPVLSPSPAFVLRVRDRYGNPVPGAEVDWSAVGWWRFHDPRLSAAKDTADPDGLVSVLLQSIPIATRVYVRGRLPTPTAGAYDLQFRAWAATPLGTLDVPGPLTVKTGRTDPITVTPISRIGDQESGIPVTVSTPSPGVVLEGATTATSIASADGSSAAATFDNLIVKGTGGDSITLEFRAPDHSPLSVRAPLLRPSGGAVRMEPGGDVEVRMNRSMTYLFVQVRVVDAEGGGVAGVPVRFMQGGATLATVMSDGQGYAAHYGYPDSGSPISAWSDGLDGSPATFHVVWIPMPGPPRYCSAGVATDTVEFGESAVLSTYCYDRFGVAVPGASIHWTSDDATIATATTVTDATGRSENTVLFDRRPGPASVRISYGGPAASTFQVFVAALLEPPNSLRVLRAQPGDPRGPRALSHFDITVVP